MNSCVCARAPLVCKSLCSGVGVPDKRVHHTHKYAYIYIYIYIYRERERERDEQTP